MSEHYEKILEVAETGSSTKILISVIVVTYNSDRFVTDTLESVKNQTFENIELVISDDCSSDNTVEICRKWIEENRGRFLRVVLITNEKNSGISANMNRGLHAAEGQWVKFIAGDDILTINCLSKCVDFIDSNRNENIELIHGIARMYYDDFEEKNYLQRVGHVKRKFNRSDITPKEQYNILLRTCPVVAPTVLMKRSVFNYVGYFDEQFTYWEDRPMWLRLTLKGFKFHYLDYELAGYRVHKSSIQKAQNNEYFSKFLLSRDLAYPKIILPNLPLFERFLNWYMIFVRRKMIQLGFIRDSKITHYLFRALTAIVEKRLMKINGNYDN